MKTVLLTLSLILVFASAASASETIRYTCSASAGVNYTEITSIRELRPDENWDSFALLLDESGRVQDGESVLRRGNHTECPIAGRGGKIYSSGTGPDGFGYRIPKEAFHSAALFRLAFVLDQDSDGMACRGAIFTCKRQ